MILIHVENSTCYFSNSNRYRRGGGAWRIGAALRAALGLGLGGERARVASFMRSALRVGVPVAELLDFIALNMPTIAF